MKKYKNQLKQYISEVIGEISKIAYPIRFMEIIWKEAKTNSDGGYFSIDYTPENFDASFYVYSEIFDEIPDKGLTDKFKNFINRGLSHEAGHVLIWELEGSRRDIEKIASQIGIIIQELLDYRL